MSNRWKSIVASSCLAGAVMGVAIAGAPAMAGRSGTKAAATVTTTPPSAGATGTPVASQTPTRAVSGTQTPTKIPVKPIVHNPTPIPSVRKHLTLPKPVVLEVGTKSLGSGLTQKYALSTANGVVHTLFILAPSFVPKGWILQTIHVDPAQDQQTPASAYLQFVPKGLTSAKGTYPSFYVNERAGASVVLFPGLTPRVVTINRGKKGIGVVKGTLVDLKPKNGSEIVHILWSRLNVAYDVSSNVTVSKLSISSLLAVAATVQ